MVGIRETIEREVKGWPGVEARVHRFGGIEFRVNGHEIGHLHGDRMADLPCKDEEGVGRVGPGATSPRVAADRVDQLLLAGRGGCRGGTPPVQEELRSVDGADGGTELIGISPLRIVGWGLDSFGPDSRSVY